MALADSWLGDRSTSLVLLPASVPVSIGFVALPSFLPLAVARHRATKIVVLALMTSTAVIAGVLVETTDDAQAGLAVLWVPYAAVPLAAAIWIGQSVVTYRQQLRVSEHRSTMLVPAGPSDRLAALAIDVVVVGGALVFPLTALSHAGRETVAAVVGVAAAAVFLGALVAWRGQTIGQAVLGLSVVESRALGRVAPTRALVRGFVVVLEVVAAPTIVLAVPAVAELVAVLATGSSLTDRFLGTRVVAAGRP